MPTPRRAQPSGLSLCLLCPQALPCTIRNLETAGQILKTQVSRKFPSLARFPPSCSEPAALRPRPQTAVRKAINCTNFAKFVSNLISSDIICFCRLDPCLPYKLAISKQVPLSSLIQALLNGLKLLGVLEETSVPKWSKIFVIFCNPSCRGFPCVPTPHPLSRSETRF